MFALELKTNQLEMFDFGEFLIVAWTVNNNNLILEQFTNHLGYAKTCLADTRYNA